MTLALVGTRVGYFEETHLDPPALEELEWWQGNLGPHMGKKEVPSDTEVLGVLWGDGSGTGSGGTLELVRSNSPST